MLGVDTIYLCPALVCCACGVRFSMDTAVYERCKEVGRSFWCPNGHEQHFGSELSRVKKQLAEAEERIAKARAQTERERERNEHERRSHAATKGQLRKTRGELDRARQRVGRGVCPCCNRTFEKLARHMASKHPEYAGDAK